MGACLTLAGVLASCAPATGSPAGSPPGPSVSPPLSSPVAEAAFVVQLVGDAPVLDGSQTGQEWVLPAALTYADDAYHLWGATFDQENSVDPRGYYATSPDGVAWAVATDDPMAGITLDLSLPGPIPGTVLREPDGTWVMWFWGIPAPAQRGAVLFRAVAPHPAGAWTAEPEPVLRGSQGDWDGFGLDYPSVVRTDEGYLMLYGGSSQAAPNEVAIGIATSPDGVTWMREPGPALRPGLCGSFDARSLNIPRLQLTDDGYLLFYNGLPDDISAHASVGVASSKDGFTWACASEAPALVGSDIPDSEGIHVIAVAATAPGPEFLVESLRGASSALWLGDAVPVD